MPLGIQLGNTSPFGTRRITYDHSANCAMPMAMRRIRKLWPLAYNKLLSLDWQTDTCTPYGATDGRRLILNISGLFNIMRTSNPIGYLSFLLVHEALHAMLNHGTRLSKFSDHHTANVAADYVINFLIKQANTRAMADHNLKRAPFPLIQGCLLDDDMNTDHSVEQLYQKLMADKDGETDDPNPKPEGETTPDEGEHGGGSGSDSSDDADGEATPDSTEGGNSTEGGDDADTDDGDGSGGGTNTDTDDGSGDGYGGDDAETDEDVLGGKWVGNEGGSTDAIKPEVDIESGESIEDVAREIEQDNERIVLQDQLNQQAGLGGSSGRRDITEHSHNSKSERWEDIIRHWMVARTQGGWNKPVNVPLYQSTKMISAGRECRQIGTWVMVVDTSGSMGDSVLQDVLGKIQDAIDTINPRKTIILPVDWVVHEAHEVMGKGPVPISLNGGGGTMFQPAFDHIADYYPDAEGIVYLTDGWANDFFEMVEPNIPLLWLTYCKSAESYPFGDAVDIDLYG